MYVRMNLANRKSVAKAGKEVAYIYIYIENEGKVNFIIECDSCVFASSYLLPAFLGVLFASCDAKKYGNELVRIPVHAVHTGPYRIREKKLQLHGALDQRVAHQYYNSFVIFFFLYKKILFQIRVTFHQTLEFALHSVTFHLSLNYIVSVLVRY